LTAHRAGLPPLKSVSPEEAGRIIDQIEPRQARQLEELGERITLLADEFYLLAERPLPDYSEEEREFQIENGVGMVSDFWEGWKGGKRLMNRLALDLTAPTRAAILTGKLGSRALAPLVERLRGLSNLQIDLIEMENSLYGPEVTVSGLLPGRDFDAAIGRTEAGLVLLPGNSLRAEDERFLDDLTLEDLRRAHPERRIEAVENSATAIVDAIRDYTKSTRPSP
jgi:NifB/MoaA-like Fe-S oxidoreductase